MGLRSPRVLKEPEFPSSVLFGFGFGFLLGSGGGGLLRVRRRCDLSFLNGMEFPQHWLQFVFLLLKVELHTRTTKGQGLEPGSPHTEPSAQGAIPYSAKGTFVRSVLTVSRPPSRKPSAVLYLCVTVKYFK